MPKHKKHSAVKSSPTDSVTKPNTPKKSSRRKNTKRNLWPKILFILGLIFVGISLLYHVHQLVQLTFYHQHLPPVTHNRTSRPVEVTIDKVDIDLPIVETVIANNTWEIADNGISHLAISARPGENGTIILYGHNTDDRFGPIRWLNIGDSITITTTDNKNHEYIVKKITTVDPNNTKVLTTQKGETLILYTCTGFADLQRYVIIAKPKSS